MNKTLKILQNTSKILITAVVGILIICTNGWLIISFFNAFGSNMHTSIWTALIVGEISIIIPLGLFSIASWIGGKQKNE